MRYLVLSSIVVYLSPVMVIAAEPELQKAGGQDTSKIVAAVLARSEAVFAGKIDYRLIKGFAGADKPDEDEYSLVFSGESWKLSWQKALSAIPHRDEKGTLVDATNLTGQAQRIESSHKRKYVNYKAVPQDNGHIGRTALILVAKQDSRFPPLPVFAGSLWFQQTRDFVRLNAAAARLGGSISINGVDVRILDWTVAKDQKPSGFHGKNEVTIDGGTLRLYAAPSLGYALPRIEYIGKDGQVAARFEAEEFLPAQNGIRIPKRLSLQYFDRKGPGFVAKYELTKVSHVNELIAEKEFAIELPPETSVSDSRDPAKPVHFRIKANDGPMPDDLSSVITVPTRSFLGKNWQTALLIGGGVGFLGIGMIFVKRRGNFAKRGVGV